MFLTKTQRMARKLCLHTCKRDGEGIYALHYLILYFCCAVSKVKAQNQHPVVCWDPGDQGRADVPWLWKKHQTQVRPFRKESHIWPVRHSLTGATVPEGHTSYRGSVAFFPDSSKSPFCAPTTCYTVSSSIGDRSNLLRSINNDA